MANRPHSCPFLTQLPIKRETCGLVSCFRESENIRPLRYTVEHVVTKSGFSLPLHRILSLRIATWGKGKWFDQSLQSLGKAPYLDSHSRKSISIQVMKRGCPLNTQPLTHAGFYSESVTGICAASVCCVSDTNKVLVLKGGAWPDPVHL